MKLDTKELKRMKHLVIETVHEYTKACGIDITISEVVVTDPTRLVHASGLINHAKNVTDKVKRSS